MLKSIEDETDIRFLYELLLERPNIANISHKEIPSYEQHTEFVKNNPYSVWFIIMDGDIRVGSIYKTKLGEIGIFVKQEYQHQGIAKQAIPIMYSFFPKRNLANVSPHNPKSISLFEKLGFNHIQNTYELQEGK